MPQNHFLKKLNKVLLINPPFPLESRYEKGLKEIGAILPSLGLCYVAAALEERGFVVEILDAPAIGLDLEETAEQVTKARPDIVGVTSLTANFSRCLALAREIKKQFNVPIMFGGPHPTLFPNRVTREENVDYAIIGEGESTTPELLEKLRTGGKLDEVRGIAYKNSGQVKVTEPRPLIEDLDTLPLPAHHLLPLECYRPAPNEYKRVPMMTMVTSRGCPYSCTFCCARRMWGQRYRQRTVDNVLGEIRLLVDKYKVRDIHFFDELWGLKASWISEFCDRVIAEKLDLTWSCFARADIISRTPRELLRKMTKAGCWRFYFGFESGSQELLNNIEKGITLEQCSQAARLTKEAGIEIMANFMLALPGETPDKAEETIRFAIELDSEITKFNVTVAYPGTDLYEQIAKGQWGTLSGEMDRYTGHFPVFVPEGYRDAEEVENIKRKAYRKFYLRPSYIFRRGLKLRSWEDLVKHIRGFRAIVHI